MRPVSAIDSVSLAVQRTKDLLFRPFNWGTYLKLGLVALITEGWGTNLRSGGNKGSRPTGGGPIINSPFDISAIKVAATIASVLLFMAFLLWLFYLVTRLRFAFFYCLVRNVKQIRPGWRALREPAGRFFRMNLVACLCYLLLLGLMALPFISGFIRLFGQWQHDGHPNLGLLLAVVLPLIPVILLMVLVAFLADLVLRDFMLPHYALENASAGEAWGWAWRAIADEKKEFFVYALLRLVLPTVALAILFMVLIVPGLLFAGAIGAVWYAIHGSFAGASGASATIGVLLQIFFGCVAFLFFLVMSIGVGGPLSTWVRAYAISFYGGRYPALGNLLNPAMHLKTDAS
ncbi:hypothetical protein DYQ86_14330 [Acidobacteria bacterium AB60]|nr:hypothetical protein DYQ86_14330 [Acidobacteria bacterium AB60]